MKYIAGTLGLLLIGLTAGAAEPQSRGGAEYKFWSVLSAPVASFANVETKDCYAVELNPGAELNIGSSVSSGGSVSVNNGALVQIDNLYMEGGTSFGVDAKWLANTVTIGTGGSITVGTLLANTITSPSALDLKVTELWMDSSVQVKDATINGDLTQNSPHFKFSKVETPEKTACFGRIKKTEHDTESSMTNYYFVMASVADSSCPENW